jgi:RHS repeat-associated protein
MFVLNSSNQIVEKYTYDAYGTPKVTDGAGNPITYPDGSPKSAIGNRFMYTGREWIGELGIYDYRHRYYLPSIGRFLETDPMGLQTEGEKLSAGQKALFSPGGSAPEAFSSSEMNLFRYCGDDPVDRSDPLGLLTWKYDKDYPTAGPGGRDAIERAIKNELSKTAKGREILDGDGTVRIHVVNLSQPDSRVGKTHTEYSKNDSRIDTWFNPKNSLLMDPKSLSKLAKHHELPEDNDRGRAVVIGHEFAHGVFKETDEHDGGRNIRDNENAIRRQLIPPMPSRHSDGGNPFPPQ